MGLFVEINRFKSMYAHFTVYKDIWIAIIINLMINIFTLLLYLLTRPNNCLIRWSCMKN